MICEFTALLERERTSSRPTFGATSTRRRVFVDDRASTAAARPEFYQKIIETKSLQTAGDQRKSPGSAEMGGSVGSADVAALRAARSALTVSDNATPTIGLPRCSFDQVKQAYVGKCGADRGVRICCSSRHLRFADPRPLSRFRGIQKDGKQLRS